MKNWNIILEIRTFTYKTDFFPYLIDEVINVKTNQVEYYLYNDEYGLKMLMFGTHLEDLYMIDYSIEMIKHYIKLYKEKFED